ncbi:MAG: DinB family protein [Anaerolineales bacterium]|nr:DinB family protein [Anaerolineales bacterium]MCW5876263.1 DinB family protein [Anaerolineales bacterium]
MDTAERKQLIESYRTAFDEFEAALAAIPQEAWLFRPAPGEWSVHEVIIHLADSETNSFLRARRLVADPELPLMAYDQDAWAVKLDYHSENTAAALALTCQVRAMTYDFIKDLPDEVWANVGIHPEYEDPYTFERWLRIYANHPRQHAGQINENHRLWKEQQGS